MHGGFPGIIAQPGVDPYHDIPILELSKNFRYNATTGYSLYEGRKADRQTARVAMSYVTGSHAIKIGFQNDRLISASKSISNPLYVSYDFLNGVPNRLTQRAGPYLSTDQVKADLGIYAQDQWTVKRLTLNYGLRFDYFTGYKPLAQARDLAGLLVDQAAWRFPIWLTPLGALGHAMVMPDSGSKYKVLRARTR